MRDVRATPAEKLILLDTLKVAGRLTGQDPAELAACEALLKSLASQAAARTIIEYASLYEDERSAA